jgi:hypothetical protein
LRAWEALSKGYSPLRLALFPTDMRSNITLADVGQARPHRGAGAAARIRSHYEAILQLLRERGPQGVLGSELYSRPDLYGRSPRNRVSELRKDGNLIEGKPQGISDWFYRLIRANAGASTTARADSHDWYEHATGRPQPQLDKDRSASLLRLGSKP